MTTASMTPPTALAMPPMPTTEPTRLTRERIGDERVDVGGPVLVRRSGEPDQQNRDPEALIQVRAASATRSAQMSIAIFRALPTGHPRLMKLEESHPPPTPPTFNMTDNHDQRQRDRGQIELVHVAEEFGVQNR